MRINRMQTRHGIAPVLGLLVWCLSTNSQGLTQCADINTPETVKWVNSIIAFAREEDGTCGQGASDRDRFSTTMTCSQSVGRIMARMYGLKTFIDSNSSQKTAQPPVIKSRALHAHVRELNYQRGVRGFLKANDIASLIPTWGDWIDLGTAGNQRALAEAAAAANRGYIVLAVWANPVAGRPGNVALVGPGPLTASPSWHGLKTPVAASFVLDDTEHAFLGRPLACALGSEKKDATHLWKYRIPLSTP
jgi:hypothetical protein